MRVRFPVGGSITMFATVSKTAANEPQKLLSTGHQRSFRVHDLLYCTAEILTLGILKVASCFAIWNATYFRVKRLPKN
jgi:hypothetical protein